MELRYITITVGNFNAQLAFYTEKLGFSIDERACFSGDREYVKLHGAASQPGLMIFEEIKGFAFKSSIILNTSDFLTDHYKLKEKGVKFLTEPKYLPNGLSAGFCDPADNYWLLIEERDYLDA